MYLSSFVNSRELKKAGYLPFSFFSGAFIVGKSSFILKRTASWLNSSMLI